jgi:phage terminase small subunit
MGINNRKEGTQMGRASKSVELSSKKFTKEEIAIRKEVQETLKGEGTLPQPSDRLNANQRKIFRHIVKHLADSKVLSTLDEFIFEKGVIAIDRLQNIEKIINQDFERIYDKDLMQAKSKYTPDFDRFVTEACLSPQARAKMGLLALNQKKAESDPLLKVLKGS